MDDTRHIMTSGRLRATIRATGAELCSLATATDELIWQAGPVWPKHAPNLFPIVGTLPDNQLHHAGQTYQMSRHGFARDMDFSFTARDAISCRLVLSDDAATRAKFPFAFRLQISYVLDAAGLSVWFTLRNPGKETLPAAMGAHPAFAWPLRPGIPKTAHSLTFAAAEPAPIRRIASNGLLMAETFPTPINGRELALREDLFAADAMILDQPASRELRYTAPGAPVIDFSWDDGFPQLGLWSPPGGDLLCIEPWHGMTTPEDFTGDFADKPGLMLIPPGGTRQARYRIDVT